MGNKIIVEFDRKVLKKMCPITNFLCVLFCKKTDKDLLKCHIYEANYEIKEQSNGNKRTED